jgi:hypothetical protein
MRRETSGPTRISRAAACVSQRLDRGYMFCSGNHTAKIKPPPTPIPRNGGGAARAYRLEIVKQGFMESEIERAASVVDWANAGGSRSAHSRESTTHLPRQCRQLGGESRIAGRIERRAGRCVRLTQKSPDQSLGKSIGTRSPLEEVLCGYMTIGALRHCAPGVSRPCAGRPDQ